MEQENFKKLLQKEYIKRRETNPNYSLRSFARNLKVDPGSLSQFLNGQRRYSTKKLTHLALQLGLKQNEFNELIKGGELTFQLINLDRHEVLGKWYYTAILESLDLRGFKPTPKWIGEKLGLPIPLVNACVNQLFSEKILVLDDHGNWINNWKNFTTQKTESIDDLALREHQKQLLDLAKNSIDNNDPDFKSHTAYVGSVNKKSIPLIKEEIKIFRRKIAKIMQNTEAKDEVYCMQINLFPQSKIGKKGESNE